MNGLPNNVTIVEVGPRDGFQNLPDFIPTEVKIKSIEKIIESGVKDVEITSFVNPKAIPQMADASEVAAAIIGKYGNRQGMHFIALVPNARGAESAVRCGITTVSIVISASESHNKANVNRSVAESLAALREIAVSFPNLAVRLDIATALGCPFEGKVPEKDVLSLVAKALDIGVREIVLCDTVGVADPLSVDSLTRAALKEVGGRCPIALHLHDTRGIGVANTYAGMLNGIEKFEASIGGLGGCPFAPGAAGNTATEDVLNMLCGMGVETGIDMGRYMEALRYVQANIKSDLTSHMAKAWPSNPQLSE
ncbi:MAG: hydroxymethylglutaryl-CoA lyase [Clostridiales Family XIII bacterium]|jgi:hydroxymethylglutaryl-CoA lyase|nr:hydroxymethylglutaryl-CoA lyase [Clostridiales Family XIII bacterium]